MYIEKNNKGVIQNKLIDYWMNNNINSNIKINHTSTIIKKHIYTNKIEKTTK